MKSIERYSFYFKIPNKEIPIQYSFHSNVSIKFFIEFIKDEMSYLTKNKIQIQENNKKINYPEDSTLEEIFKEKLEIISFSIKYV
jgi:hypothetical protein